MSSFEQLKAHALEVAFPGGEIHRYGMQQQAVEREESALEREERTRKEELKERKRWDEIKERKSKEELEAKELEQSFELVKLQVEKETELARITASGKSAYHVSDGECVERLVYRSKRMKMI